MRLFSDGSGGLLFRISSETPLHGFISTVGSMGRLPSRKSNDVTYIFRTGLENEFAFGKASSPVLDYIVLGSARILLEIHPIFH